MKEIDYKLALISLDLIKKNDFIEFCIEELSNGSQMDSIKIFAGLNKNDSYFDIEKWFNYLLAENNWEIPNEDMAIRYILNYLFNNFLAEKISVSELFTLFSELRNKFNNNDLFKNEYINSILSLFYQWSDDNEKIFAFDPDRKEEKIKIENSYKDELNELVYLFLNKKNA